MSTVYAHKNILILGEEDFSLSSAMMQFEPAKITACCFKQVKKRAQTNVRALLKADGNEVHPYIDVRALAAACFDSGNLFRKKFDIIMFGFPTRDVTIRLSVARPF